MVVGLRLKLDTTMAVIVATAILHNIACDEKEDVPPLNRVQENAINIINEGFNVVAHQENNVNINNITRHNLINYYFANL